MKALLAAALLLLPSVALADEAADRDQFTDYVAACTEEFPADHEKWTTCLADQVGSNDSYLGDILVETDGIVGDANVPLLHRAQDAWEAYRTATCAYQVATAKADPFLTEEFCLLRITNQRIEEILAGDAFANPGDIDAR